MSIAEQAVLITCGASRLVGVLVRPQAPAQTGVVVIVGGPQYRAGSHRQFVSLTRHLARAGYAALRFDHRGMGDSEGEPRSFEDISKDVAAAIDALQASVPEVEQVVLWGLCDAASAALLYVDGTSDARVRGLALANPWVRSEQGLARAHVKHYYLARIREGAFWAKLLSGGVALSAMTGLWRNLGAARTKASAASDISFRDRMARGWGAFPGRILLLSSQSDFTAREFDEYAAASPVWKKAMRLVAHTRADLPGADHTFSTPGSARAAEAATVKWLAGEARGDTP